VSEPFNPLSRIALAESVPDPFVGAGVYAIYYIGAPCRTQLPVNAGPGSGALRLHSDKLADCSTGGSFPARLPGMGEDVAIDASDLAAFAVDGQERRHRPSYSASISAIKRCVAISEASFGGKPARSSSGIGRP
jgi:hypothetical protein